jgi:hypothetical protein
MELIELYANEWDEEKNIQGFSYYSIGEIF